MATALIPWTKELIKEVGELHRAGWKVSEISVKIGIDRNRVSNKIQILKRPVGVPFKYKIRGVERECMTDEHGTMEILDKHVGGRKKGPMGDRKSTSGRHSWLPKPPVERKPDRVVVSYKEYPHPLDGINPSFRGAKVRKEVYA